MIRESALKRQCLKLRDEKDGQWVVGHSHVSILTVLGLLICMPLPTRMNLRAGTDFCIIVI